MPIKRVHRFFGGRWVREHTANFAQPFAQKIARQTNTDAAEGCCWCGGASYSPACAAVAFESELRMDGSAPPDDFRADVSAPPSLRGCSPYAKSPYQAIFGGAVKVTCTFVDAFRTATRCTSRILWYINGVLSGSMDFNEFTPVPSSTSVNVSQGDYWGLTWEMCDFPPFPFETSAFGNGCSRGVTATEMALQDHAYTITPLAISVGDCPTAEWTAGSWNSLPDNPGQVERYSLNDWYTFASNSGYYKFLGGRLKVIENIAINTGSCFCALTRTAVGPSASVDLWIGTLTGGDPKGVYTRGGGCLSTATVTVG